MMVAASDELLTGNGGSQISVLSETRGAVVMETNRGAAPSNFSVARHPSRICPSRSACRSGPRGPNSSTPSNSSTGRPHNALEAPGARISSSRSDACRIVNEGSRQMKALPTDASARVMPCSAASVRGLPNCPAGPGRIVGATEINFGPPPPPGIFASKLRF